MTKRYPNKYPDDTVIADRDSSVADASSNISCLVMIRGEYLGRRYPILNKPLLIGRTVECDIQLADDCISRRHCSLLPCETEVVVFDLNSTNGSYVNGNQVSSQPLKNGDRLTIGRSIFKFLSGDHVEHAYHEEIYRLKTTDSLTGAFNKRYFEDELRHELSRFFRHRHALSLLMMDIDHFKKINDEYGHLAGDKVLAELGAIIYSSIRFEDTFSRYGGEEFALLMPEMNLFNAADSAERLRKLISNTAFKFEDYELQVTISIGVAEAGADTNKPEDLVLAADKCLYEAKRSGRNRVEPNPERLTPNNPPAN